jgi:UDP-N-acetylmuramate--alanine ligase
MELKQMKDLKNIYFLGIGGIGMSALAKYFIQSGKNVMGYDKVETDLTKELIAMGAQIHYEDKASLFPANIDLVVYTPAIPKDSVLWNHIQQSGIPIMKRSETLGLITKDKFTIAVAGSHGKTSVSSMISYVLQQCGIECSAFLGGISVNFGSNYVFGTEDIVVVEADEFDRSFLQLQPNLIVITSIDTDHLDIYGTKENIYIAFQEFVDKLDKNGILVINEKAAEFIQTDAEKIIYGFDNEEFNATNVEVKEGFGMFDINEEEQKYKLHFNGRHNIENALATVVVATLMDAEEQEIAKALSGFKGIKRRFEYLYEGKNAILIDDYAHHPTEIAAILQSVKEIYPFKKVTAIFQPHLFSRTKDLHLDFAAALDMADEVILLPIYPARELPIAGVSSALIQENMTTASRILEKEAVLEYIKKEEIEVLVTIGAGDINLLHPKLITLLHGK